MRRLLYLSGLPGREGGLSRRADRAPGRCGRGWRSVRVQGLAPRPFARLVGVPLVPGAFGAEITPGFSLSRRRPSPSVAGLPLLPELPEVLAGVEDAQFLVPADVLDDGEV